MTAPDSRSSQLPGGPAPANVTPTKWTVMVFMGAEVEDGNAPMIGPALDDLAEMAAVGSGGALEIFVQVHTRDAIRRGRITRSMRKNFANGSFAGLKTIGPVSPANTTDDPTGGELRRFLVWSLKEARHEAANQAHCSMLVLWGHAYNFAMGHSPERSNGMDALDFVEIGTRLRTVQDRAQSDLGLTTKPKLDIVAFDACDVATAEVACELAPYADFLLSSQVGVPVPGWPYGEVLKRLRVPYGKLMSPAELGHWIVARFCESYVQTRTVSLSMLDLTRAAGLAARISALADELTRFIRDGGPAARDLVAEVLWNANTEIDKPYVDVADVCDGLLRECGDSGVHEAARQLGDFVIAPPVNVQPRSQLVGDAGDVGPERLPRYPFVTASGRNAAETARLNGVSLYAPHVAADYDYLEVRELYRQFRLTRMTGWAELAHSLV